MDHKSPASAARNRTVSLDPQKPQVGGVGASGCWPPQLLSTRGAAAACCAAAQHGCRPAGLSGRLASHPNQHRPLPRLLLRIRCPDQHASLLAVATRPQGFYPVQPQATFLPGDSLAMACAFESSDVVRVIEPQRGGARVCRCAVCPGLCPACVPPTAPRHACACTRTKHLPPLPGAGTAATPACTAHPAPACTRTPASLWHRQAGPRGAGGAHGQRRDVQPLHDDLLPPALLLVVPRLQPLLRGGCWRWPVAGCRVAEAGARAWLRARGAVGGGRWAQARPGTCLSCRGWQLRRPTRASQAPLPRASLRRAAARAGRAAGQGPPAA